MCDVCLSKSWTLMKRSQPYAMNTFMKEFSSAAADNFSCSALDGHNGCATVPEECTVKRYVVELHYYEHASGTK